MIMVLAPHRKKAEAMAEARASAGERAAPSDRAAAAGADQPHAGPGGGAEPGSASGDGVRSGLSGAARNDFPATAGVQDDLGLAAATMKERLPCRR